MGSFGCCTGLLMGTLIAVHLGNAPQVLAGGDAETKSSNGEECECAPGFLWAVVLTLLVVFLVSLAGYFFWKYYWFVKHGKHLVLVTDVERGNTEFAFDNPGFKEGTPSAQKRKMVEQKRTKWTNFGETVASANVAISPKAAHLSDDAVTSQAESQSTNVVPLKSHDFAGLGFDICGNIKDGIFVKDLLHHGPASQSGHIKPGDRIAAVRINFSHMVYEDAVSILSYASPYEVEVEIESTAADSGPSSSPNSGDHQPDLKHPFYRSQSSFSNAQQTEQQGTTTSEMKNHADHDTAALRSQQQRSTVTARPAVLEVSEITEKMPKYGGVKVLPDISPQVSQMVKKMESQQEISEREKRNSNASSSFDEVDLKGEREVEAEANKGEMNVKSIIAKGLQSIKDKISGHIRKSPAENLKSRDREEEEKDRVDFQSAKINFTDEFGLRNNQHAVAENKDVMRVTSSSSEDAGGGTGDGRNDDEQINNSNNYNNSNNNHCKRKAQAPMPPMRRKEMQEYGSDCSGLMNEIQNDILNKYLNDSDSEGTQVSADKNSVIELTCAHVTVHHHHQDESNRKATSLGDLYKISDVAVTAKSAPPPLERAASLGLEEVPTKGNRRTSSQESDEVVLSFTKEETPMRHTDLKRSSMFGTLEEVLKQSNEDNASTISIPDEDLIASTPMKLTTTYESSKLDCSSGDRDVERDDNFLQPSSDVDLAPALPTSPIPTLYPYVTEVTVTSANSENLSTELEKTLFVTANDVRTLSSSSVAEEHHTDKDEGKADVKNGKENPFQNDKDERSRSNNESVVNGYNDSIIKNGTIASDDNTSGIYAKSAIVTTNEEKLASDEDCAVGLTKIVATTTPDSGNYTASFCENKSEEEEGVQRGTREELVELPSAIMKSTKNSTVSGAKYAKTNGEHRPKLKSPTSASKLPKLSATPPSKVSASRIPVRANTEPSLKIPSLSVKDDHSTAKNKKYKVPNESGNFSPSSSSHSIHRKSLSPVRVNGSSASNGNGRGLTSIMLETRK